MSAIAIGGSALAFLLVLILARVPIALAMILTGGGGIIWLSGPAILLSQFKTLAWGVFSNYDLSVAPLFLLMGHLAGRTGLSRDLFAGAHALVGRVRGGVAIAAIGACAGFGAVCGSSLATASTMGKVALPELRRLNYAPSLATGTLAAGGTLGILIPPSVVLILYAVSGEANIVTMFMAALAPGLLAVLGFALVIRLEVWLNPASGPRGAGLPPGELWRALRGLAPVGLIFGVVIGGLYGGWFTPTPAASVGVFLTGIYGLATGKLKLSGLRASLLETASSTAMIYLIILGAELMKILMARSGLPLAMAEALGGAGWPPLAILALVLGILILLGAVMESLSLILLVVPFFWPVISGLDFGLDGEMLKIWFGILALVVVELGLITPPVGLNVFVIHDIARDVPLARIFRGVLPFAAMEIVRVALLVAFPALVLWLPGVLGGL
jgi:tripartite ATP-independent transporter DctM subunit